MNRDTRKFRTTVFKSLDTIFNACKTTVKSWDKRGTHIPVKLFAQLVDKAKWHTGVKDSVLRRNEENFSKMISKISEGLGKSAVSFDTDTIPLKVIKEVFQKIKDDFDKGIENPKKL